MQDLSKPRRRMMDVAEHMDIDEGLVGRLCYPQQSMSATLPVRMDDGSMRLLKGWWCRCNDIRGPAKEGVCLHPGATLDEVTI